MESVERRVVVRPAVVAVVSTQNGGEPPVLRSQWRVHAPPGILAQRRQLARQAFSFRLVLPDEPAIPGPPAVVGEAQEGEVSGRRSPRRCRERAANRPHSQCSRPLCMILLAWRFLQSRWRTSFARGRPMPWRYAQDDDRGFGAQAADCIWRPVTTREIPTGVALRPV